RRHAAEILVDLGDLVSETLDPAAVGRRIADSVRRLVSARSATVYQVLPGSGDLLAIASAGDFEATFGPNFVVPYGTGTSGLASATRAPVATTDLAADPRIALPEDLRARMAALADRAVLSVPML